MKNERLIIAAVIVALASLAFSVSGILLSAWMLFN